MVPSNRIDNLGSYEETAQWKKGGRIASRSANLTSDHRSATSSGVTRRGASGYSVHCMKESRDTVKYRVRLVLRGGLSGKSYCSFFVHYAVLVDLFHLSPQRLSMELARHRYIGLVPCQLDSSYQHQPGLEARKDEGTAGGRGRCEAYGR